MDIRTSSWHASREMVRQQNTLDKHIVDSQETTLNVSNQLAAQTHLIQENNSWAQRLTKMLGGYAASSVHALVLRTLSLVQLFTVSSHHTRGSRRQDMGHGQADHRSSHAATKY